MYKTYRYSYIGFFVLLLLAKGIAGAMAVTAHIFALNVALFVVAGVISLFVGFFPLIKQDYWKRVTWAWGILASVAIVVACIITLYNLKEKQPVIPGRLPVPTQTWP